jgi:hypothetical protein
MNNPFHSVQSAAIFKLDSEYKMTFAFRRFLHTWSTISNVQFQLLKKDWNTLVAVLVPLDHASQHEGCWGSSAQFCHQFCRLEIIDFVLFLLLAQQLESVLQHPPSLGSKGCGTFSAKERPPWSLSITITLATSKACHTPELAGSS